jgi:hypothetical protein
MKTEENDDGSISYTLTAGERMVLAMVLGFAVGRTYGYRKGRIATSKAIKKSGLTIPSL